MKRGCAKNTPVYTGNNILLLGALVMGANGAVSTLANAVPELFAAVVTAHREGRTKDARELQLTVARLEGAFAGFPYMASAKHLLERRGLPAAGPGFRCRSSMMHNAHC